jgi:hypothetical protein
MQKETVKPIADLFGSRYNFQPVKSHRSERGDLLDFFTEKINAGRVGTKYPPITKSSMGNLLSIYSTEDLYHLRIRCERAKNFTATFWYFCRPKQTTTPNSA